MKIGVITPRYAISGVPLAQLRFARALAEDGHEVDLIIGRVDPHLTVPDVPGGTVHVLRKPNVRSMFVPLCTYLKRNKPDVVFSAEDHLNALVLLAAIVTRSSVKISGSCRVRPFDTYSNVPFTKRWFLKHLMRAVSWRADALTCVSREMVSSIGKSLRTRLIFASTISSRTALPEPGSRSPLTILGSRRRRFRSSSPRGRSHRGKASRT